MNCQERRDQMLLYSLGMLDHAERDELRAHLAAGCATCAGSLAEAEATLAHLPDSLELVAPPPGARERFFDRLAAAPRRVEPVGKNLNRPAAASNRWGLFLAIAASLALLVVSATQFRRIDRQSRELQQFSQQLEAAQDETGQFKRQVTRLQQQVDVAAQTIEAMQSRNVRLVSLAGAQPQPQAWAHILWDEQHRQWHLFVSGMSPAGPNKTYELWFVTKDQRKIPAGTFDVDERGRATLVVALPADLGPLALAAVTDEPAGGSPQPTGNFQLLGEI